MQFTQYLIDFVREFDYNIRVSYVIEREVAPMEYLSIKQTSEKWGISTRRIQILCGEERIPGAVKIGSFWAIPADAERPKDERIKSGKYIKNEAEKR